MSRCSKRATASNMTTSTREIFTHHLKRNLSKDSSSPARSTAPPGMRKLLLKASLLGSTPDWLRKERGRLHCHGLKGTSAFSLTTLLQKALASLTACLP